MLLVPKLVVLSKRVLASFQPSGRFLKMSDCFLKTSDCFLKMSDCFLKMSEYFFKPRFVFHQTTSGDVHRSATLKMLSLCPKLFCATEKSPSNFLHRPRIDVAV